MNNTLIVIIILFVISCFVLYKLTWKNRTTTKIKEFENDRHHYSKEKHTNHPNHIKFNRYSKKNYLVFLLFLFVFLCFSSFPIWFIWFYLLRISASFYFFTFLFCFCSAKNKGPPFPVVLQAISCRCSE